MNCAYQILLPFVAIFIVVAMLSGSQFWIFASVFMYSLHESPSSSHLFFAFFRMAYRLDSQEWIHSFLFENCTVILKLAVWCFHICTKNTNRKIFRAHKSGNCGFLMTYSTVVATAFSLLFNKARTLLFSHLGSFQYKFSWQKSFETQGAAMSHWKRRFLLAEHLRFACLH